MQRDGRACSDPEARRAALALLTRGIGTPGEIAELAGVSRQVVEGWANRAGLDWRKVKHAILMSAWRKEFRRVVQEPPTGVNPRCLEYRD